MINTTYAGSARDASPSTMGQTTHTASTGSPATPSTKAPRLWLFSMIDSNKEVVGSGVIVAPSAGAARVSAERLLAGTNNVVIRDHNSPAHGEGVI